MSWSTDETNVIMLYNTVSAFIKSYVALQLY